MIFSLLFTSSAFFFTLAIIVTGNLFFALEHSPQPQAIFLLGGDPKREAFTAYFSLNHEELPVWISSRRSPLEIIKVFKKYRGAGGSVYIDNRASDTVTNFTSLASDFKDSEIHHVFLVTASYHMPRAKAIAFWVFGSRGIWCTPVEVLYPSGFRQESLWRSLRDIVRSWFWLMTGHTGASLNPTPPSL